MIGVVDLDEVGRIQIVRVYDRAVIFMMLAPQQSSSSSHELLHFVAAAGAWVLLAYR